MKPTPRFSFLSPIFIMGHANSKTEARTLTFFLSLALLILPIFARSAGARVEALARTPVESPITVTVLADGKSIVTSSQHTHPLDVLAEAGVALVGLDYTIPGPDALLDNGDTLQVVRVQEAYRFQDEPLPYKTIYQPTDTLDLDTQSVISAGAPGVQRQRVRTRYENGVAVAEVVDGQWLMAEPVNEVMGYGTRITTGVVETPMGPREYWRVVRMRVTAYTAASSGKPPDHPNYGITASGRPAGTGIVAVDPNVVPFRSEVYVPGYGVGFAGDTGGGIKGRWIDLGYDEDELVAWNGYVDVYYLTPIPAEINYLIPAVLP